MQALPTICTKNGICARRSNSVYGLAVAVLSLLLHSARHAIREHAALLKRMTALKRQLRTCRPATLGDAEGRDGGDGGDEAPDGAVAQSTQEQVRRVQAQVHAAQLEMKARLQVRTSPQEFEQVAAELGMDLQSDLTSQACLLASQCIDVSRTVPAWLLPVPASNITVLVGDV